MKIPKRGLAKVLLFFTAFAGSLLFYFSSVAVPVKEERQGKVLGESIVAEGDEVAFGLFVEGLLSKRKEYGDTNCDFVVSEDRGAGLVSWEGNLIWSTSDNYKLFIDGNSRIYSVNTDNLYRVLEGRAKESLGNIQEGGSGFAEFAEIRNYVFEDFLGDMAENPEKARIAGEETVDGIRCFILESDLSVAEPRQEIRRRFYVSEEGILLKAAIEVRTDDYEVYDSSGAAITQQGYMKKINIEVKNRVFF